VELPARQNRLIPPGGKNLRILWFPSIMDRTEICPPQSLAWG